MKTTIRIGRYRAHSCLLFPTCWRERRKGSSFFPLVIWLNGMGRRVFGVEWSKDKRAITMPHRARAVATTDQGQ